MSKISNIDELAQERKEVLDVARRTCPIKHLEVIKQLMDDIDVNLTDEQDRAFMALIRLTKFLKDGYTSHEEDSFLENEDVKSELRALGYNNG